MPGSKPSTSRAQATGSAKAVSEPSPGPVDAGEVGDEGRADRAAPAHGPVQHAGDGRGGASAQPLGGVDRAEHLLQGEPLFSKREADVLAVAEQPVGAAGQPVAVDLEAVAQAGLHHVAVLCDTVQLRAR